MSQSVACCQPKFASASLAYGLDDASTSLSYLSVNIADEHDLLRSKACLQRGHSSDITLRKGVRLRDVDNIDVLERVMSWGWLLCPYTISRVPTSIMSRNMLNLYDVFVGMTRPRHLGRS